MAWTYSACIVNFALAPSCQMIEKERMLWFPEVKLVLLLQWKQYFFLLLYKICRKLLQVSDVSFFLMKSLIYSFIFSFHKHFLRVCDLSQRPQAWEWQTQACPQAAQTGAWQIMTSSWCQRRGLRRSWWSPSFQHSSYLPRACKDLRAKWMIPYLRGWSVALASRVENEREGRATEDVGSD